MTLTVKEKAFVNQLARRLDVLEDILLRTTAARKAPEPIEVIGLSRPAPLGDRPVPAAAGFIMPSDQEFTKLVARVHASYPRLNDLDGLIDPDGVIDAEFANVKGDVRRAVYLQQTRLAFIALTFFQRTPQPDYKHYAMFGKPSQTLKLGPFLTAMTMHGDIPYTRLFEHDPPLSLGLSKHEGADAKDGWKRVLDFGPAPPVGPVSHAPSKFDQVPVRITQEF